MIRYIRLLSYNNACKVIDFINAKKNGDDFAHITVCGVATRVSDEKKWDDVEVYMKSLKVRYEVGVVAPHKVNEEIVSTLKEKGVIA